MFHHIIFWVSNAKQSASYFMTKFGFKQVGYTGLETGDTYVSSHVIQLNDILFIFNSPLKPGDNQVSQFLLKHGDGVKNIGFKVENCRQIFEKAVARGAQVVEEPVLSGNITSATIQVIGSDITHTFIEGEYESDNVLYSTNIVNQHLPPINLQKIDHVVTNTDDMQSVVEWYEKVLQFHRFWSVDESVLHTEYSALRSIVVANKDETIKMPINEPAPGLKKSQIDEFLEYNGGTGVQHIALSSNDIISDVNAMYERGVEFLAVPSSYYAKLRSRLELSHKCIKEDLDLLEKYKILVDFDADGYLLQIFTKPLADRTTLFIEIIQRYNFNGFGVGNFKSLFECIEDEQRKRNNF